MKRMLDELDPRYDHQKTEARIYELWESSGYFNPDNLPVSKIRNSKLEIRNFSIIMPPPNANGSLHLGHAVFVTLQDILIRFARMQGKKTLWLPSADHAGFETQVVFDKKLDKEGRNRFLMDREELWQEIWDFTQKNKSVMENQLRKLGASADWSREKFTLDPDIVQTVYETFEKLYDDGLAYRDLRVVNWCPKHKTALSDLEVKYVERTDPLYYISYGPLSVATVRPETKFGDTALAVNPKDKRYAKYIGKEIEIKDILGTKKLKVIADDVVDPKFGTGVVKVTPAHDQTDFEIWQRHKKEIEGPKVVIDENGRLTGDVGEYIGLKVTEAREKVVDRIKEIGILEKIDATYVHQVATCYKCGSTLEPRPLPQWFVKTKPLAQKAIAAAPKIKFFPANSKKVYLHWLKNIRDWNISRQIVWGIRIPAWFCINCNKPKINLIPKANWFLIRHGQTDWNKEGRTQGYSDPSLNQEGKIQAEKAAKILKNKKVDVVISSDLLRAKETAEIIAKITGAELIIDKRLRERNLGSVEGKLSKEWILEYPDISRTPQSRPPGGESFEELEKRVWDSFEHHKSNHARKNVVIVSHGGAIRTLLGKLKGWDFKSMVQTKTKNTQIIELTLDDPCEKCGSDTYEQDPDVFDTWFSSGQWPFATLMSSSKSKIKNPAFANASAGRQKSKLTDDFKEFYPTDVMETGYDILFFWVTRMVMLSLYLTGKIPFKNVYLNGLVRDKDRQKMSKSKGNVIDPLGVAEIYGADALRMALVVGNTAGNDIIISEEKIRGYRNFATKIWNVARFILMNKPVSSIPPSLKLRRADKYHVSSGYKKHLAELERIKAKATKHIEKFEFHLAAETLYHYVWHTFADKVIENSKERLRGENEAEKAAAYDLLETILLECLKMLHPFMPFVTEEIYETFRPGEMLMIQEW